MLTPLWLELIEEGRRDGSIRTEYAKELSELLSLVNFECFIRLGYQAREFQGKVLSMVKNDFSGSIRFIMKERPEVYIVVTFGLGYRLESLSVDAAVEPYLGRFIHHVLVSGTGEVDDELMGWVKEAAVFSAGKR